jgi:hypothetical protein
MGRLRNRQSEIKQRGFTGGAGKADTLALRSRFTYMPSGFRRLAVVDVLNKSAEMQHVVAGLLSKSTWKRAEKSGKRGPQTVESNEINVMEKTLNQKVGGSIPPRLTSIKS